MCYCGREINTPSSLQKCSPVPFMPSSQSICHRVLSISLLGTTAKYYVVRIHQQHTSTKRWTQAGSFSSFSRWLRDCLSCCSACRCRPTMFDDQSRTLLRDFGSRSMSNTRPLPCFWSMLFTFITSWARFCIRCTILGSFLLSTSGCRAT